MLDLDSDFAKGHLKLAEGNASADELSEFAPEDPEQCLLLPVQAEVSAEPEQRVNDSPLLEGYVQPGVHSVGVQAVVETGSTSPSLDVAMRSVGAQTEQTSMEAELADLTYQLYYWREKCYRAGVAKRGEWPP